MRRIKLAAVVFAVAFIPGCQTVDWLTHGMLSERQWSTVNTASQSPNERVQSQAAQAGDSLRQTYNWPGRSIR
jgi:hypothetical protein